MLLSCGLRPCDVPPIAGDVLFLCVLFGIQVQLKPRLGMTGEGEGRQAPAKEVGWFPAAPGRDGRGGRRLYSTRRGHGGEAANCHQIATDMCVRYRSAMRTAANHEPCS